jgi:uncharacterized damage-inducible protein DinB
MADERTVSKEQPVLVRPRWLERTFRFGHPHWMLADFAERLRGTVHRLEALLADLEPATLRTQDGGRWSILQNAGHLGDVEELWIQRVADLRAGRKVHTPADGDRFRRLAESHRSRTKQEVLRHFETRRAPFLAALAAADEPLQRADALHERLGVSMRLVDLAQFVAEHDDHHLLRIRELRRC